MLESNLRYSAFDLLLSDIFRQSLKLFALSLFVAWLLIFLDNGSYVRDNI